ncbi:MAG TPA: hypothetical protein VFG59_18855 [Anaeromyxobacter sp.]|nr:hypothetical protein [Anaeromyxobacter sp.]
MTNAELQVTSAEPPAHEPGGHARRHVRNYLLDTALQLKLASYLVAVATALSLGLGWLLWRAYRETSEVVELSDADVSAALQSAFTHVDRLRIVVVAVALIAVLLCLLAAAVVITHRIAGPAYAIGRTCRRVAEGDLSLPPPLRSRDLLTDLGDEVAAMVRALRGRETRQRDLIAAAAAALRDPLAPAQARQEMARHLESLASEMERRLAP